MAKRRKQGEGTLRLRKDGRWEGRIVVGYDDKGLPITKNVTAKTKTECAEKLETLKEKYGRPTEKINSEMPFGEWIDFWYKTYCKHTIRLTTQLEYESRIYKHIIPEIGSIPLNKLTQADLQQFYARTKSSGRKIKVEAYGTGLSDRVVRAIHANCRSALEKAVQEGLIRTNPAVGCKLPPKKSREMKVLTPNEVIRFLTRAKEEGYYELFLLELGTGMRRGEILALKWSDLNFTTGELRIERQVNVFNKEQVISTPKTKSSIRTIILPPSLLQILSDYKTTVDSEWIFPSPLDNTKTRHPSAVRKRMQIILERAGCKKVRFHDLRHTFSTMALESGMDIKSLSSMLGHVSSATTIDIYSHITNTMQRQAAAKIDRQIGGTDTPIPQADERVRIDDSQLEIEPYKPKVRKSGTGCVTMINDHLYEGRYTPTNAYGKREAHNIYAKTREECEEKLAELIVQVKADIKAEKERLKTVNESFSLELQ
ncbi:MAG: site-specific integrase [Oscillospiraceae bacterium]|nr:site-specific integrase [Oscillospiraceae bacterium]